MGNYKDFNVKVDEKEVIRLLGYKDGESGEEVKDSIKCEIEKCSIYIKPQITWEKINITEIRQNNVLLENGILLEGEFIAEKLKKCQYVVVTVFTLGQEVDKIVKAAFDNEDYLRGMILECIATTALGETGKEFWIKMTETIEGSNVGITHRLSPGDAGWEINEQTKIFECLKNNDLDVTLMESYMMKPLKSASVLYGFGDKIGITRVEHICSECSMKNCIYRINERMEVTVIYGDGKKVIKADKNSNLLDVLRKNNIFVNTPCGGNASCGKCKVLIVKGVKVPSKHDLEHLSDQEINKGIRLACTILVSSDLEILIENEPEKMDVITMGEEQYIDIDPMIIKKHLIIDKPSIEDQRDDYKRITDALCINDLVVNYDMLPTITGLLRDANFNITATVYDSVLLHIEAGNTVHSSYGIAVDIGTTTIACYLVGLVNGKTIDVESSVNKQRAYGADVISRISFTIENEAGTKILKDLIINQINDMIRILCKRNSINSNNIYNMSVVGNTTMTHLLLGLPSKNISLAPFVPVLTTGVDFKAKEIGIEINGYVSIVPSIASYVGSDITAGILASGMMDSEEYSLLLDLGTNGEIALGNSRSIITCSTAAGPAFEGANIKCGIGGVNGAISEVNLSEKNIYKTINDHKACGICGSGVLDIVSEFIKHKIIDKTGKMANEDEMTESNLIKRLNSKDCNKQFILEENTVNGESIVFTQKDIREVQLAKAAISAGIQLMVNELRINYSDIDKVYIGGGFGNFMSIESALVIGLIPNDLRGKIHSIGNCAGIGAKLYLLSKNNRKRIFDMTSKASYIELSNRKDFQDYYIDSMMF